MEDEGRGEVEVGRSRWRVREWGSERREWRGKRMRGEGLRDEVD